MSKSKTGSLRLKESITFATRRIDARMVRTEQTRVSKRAIFQFVSGLQDRELLCDEQDDQPNMGFNWVG